MTAAQKAAKEKFSKAIAYRSKTGVSLKEAFAHVYGKKVGEVKKKAAPKKKAVVKKAAVKKVIAKKAAPKKVTGSHKDTKSHNVNIRVVSGTERDFKPNYLDPKSVLNEILFFQNLVTKNNEKLKKEKNIKIRAALRYEIANNKKWIATNKKQLKELLNKLK